MPPNSPATTPLSLSVSFTIEVGGFTDEVAAKLAKAITDAVLDEMA